MLSCPIPISLENKNLELETAFFTFGILSELCRSLVELTTRWCKNHAILKTKGIMLNA